MTSDDIEYEELAQEALRGVVRQVLLRVAKEGLPGDHHFYIAFDTQAEGVSISDRLHDQYPEEMTVVLQHQFWDLKVDDHQFEVQLSFNNVPEHLVIPFMAIKVFFDPSVPYGLQFGAAAEIANDEEHAVHTLPEILGEKHDHAGLPSLNDLAPVIGPEEEDEKINEVAEEPEAEPSEEEDRGSAEIVELDAFRKK